MGLQVQYTCYTGSQHLEAAIEAAAIAAAVVVVEIR